MPNEEALLTAMTLRMIAFADESDTQAGEAYVRARHNCYLVTGIDVAELFRHAADAGITLSWEPAS